MLFRQSGHRGKAPSPRTGIRRLSGCEPLEARRLLAFDPTALEQAMLEHINRTRMDPQGELDVLFTSISPTLVSSDAEVNRALNHFEVDRATLLQQWTLLTAVPPLAWNENLSNSATLHNQAMQAADEQSHQVAGELALGPRTTAAGYIFEEVHENVYAFGENDFHTHAAFIIDWGFSNEDPNNPGGGGFDDGIQDDLGHRTNYLRNTVYEVGIDVLSDTNPATDVGPLLVTQEFGRPQTWGGPFLLGVVFEDGFSNGIYDPGEGYSGIQISISGTGGTFSTSTMTAGGYQLRIPAGTYTVTASGSNIATQSKSNVVIGTDNVKVDFLVSSGNVPPVAHNDIADVAEEGSISINVLANDTDEKNQISATTVAISQQPTHGGVIVNSLSGQITYTPSQNFFGVDTFRYTVRDTEGAISNAATVTVTVTPVNDAPMATGTTVSVATGQSVSIPMEPRVTDVDNAINWTSLVVVASAQHGTAVANTTTRAISYTPTIGFTGVDSFTYRVADATGTFSQAATITLNVTAAQVAPIANPDRMIASSGLAATFNVKANDQDDDNLANSTISIVTGPGHGTASVVSGQLRFTPNTGYTGWDTMTYRLTDAGTQTSNTATVSVIVTDPARPWRNPIDPEDVNLSGTVTPTDVVAVVNAFGNDASSLSSPPLVDGDDLFLVDVDGNRTVNPVDVVRVVNRVLGLTQPQSSSANAAYRLESTIALESSPFESVVLAVSSQVQVSPRSMDSQTASTNNLAAVAANPILISPDLLARRAFLFAQRAPAVDSVFSESDNSESLLMWDSLPSTPSTYSFGSARDQFFAASSVRDEDPRCEDTEEFGQPWDVLL